MHAHTGVLRSNYHRVRMPKPEEPQVRFPQQPHVPELQTSCRCPEPAQCFMMLSRPKS